jgi:Arc/MetJ family transcription regulator
MKNNLRTLVMTAAVAFFAFSCQENDDTAPAISDAEVDEVAGYIVNEILPIEIQGGTETDPFGLRTTAGDDLNARIAAGRPPFPLIRLGACAEELELTEEQVAEARALAEGLLECRKDVHETFRTELKEVIGRMEAARKAAVEKLRKEEITPAQFRAEMENIRKSFHIAMKEIREKHKETIKPCVRDYVKQLKELLGEENWESLKTCLKEKNDESESED